MSTFIYLSCFFEWFLKLLPLATFVVIVSFNRIYRKRQKLETKKTILLKLSEICDKTKNLPKMKKHKAEKLRNKIITILEIEIEELGIFDLSIKKKKYSQFKENISDKLDENISDKLEENISLGNSWILAEFQRLLKK